MARFTWAKIYCDLLRHPLLRDRPDCDVRLVLGLILDAKEHTDDGVLRRMTAQSAKRLCNISSPVAKVQAGIDYLVSVGWLIPHPDQAYEIKDFVPRQAADSAAERAARWRDEHQHERVTKRDGEAQRKGNDSVTKRDAPVTVPLPEVEEEEEVEKEEDQRTLSNPVPDSPAGRVFLHWQRVMNKPRAIFDKKRENLIKARLSEGRTEDELCLAVDGCANSPFHMGKNDRHEKYNDIKLICRDAAQVEKFMPALPPAGCEPAKPKRTHEDRMAIIEGQFGKSA